MKKTISNIEKAWHDRGGYLYYDSYGCLIYRRSAKEDEEFIQDPNFEDADELALMLLLEDAY